jgi:hypothetical protein
VLWASFDYFTATHKVIVQFSADVSASLSTSDVQVQNLSNPGGLTVSGWSYDPLTNTATFTFTPAQLADGNYRATLLAAGITDATGNPLDGDGNGIGGDDHVYDFFFLRGDADHNRIVDIADLGIVGTNWQQSPRTWSQGDFDYSGKVDIVDLGIVGTNWQTSLVPPPTSSSSDSVAAPTMRAKARMNPRGRR